jgi:hypothetical protein
MFPIALHFLASLARRGRVVAFPPVVLQHTSIYFCCAFATTILFKPAMLLLCFPHSGEGGKGALLFYIYPVLPTAV